jgi:hypothetical protein
MQVAGILINMGLLPIEDIPQLMKTTQEPNRQSPSS